MKMNDIERSAFSKPNHIRNHSNRDIKIRSIKKIFIVMIYCCLIGCGGSETIQKSENDSGSIVFSLEWTKYSESGTTGQIHQNGEMKFDSKESTMNICNEYNLNSISAYLFDSSGLQIKSGSWPCATHQGTLSEVPSGSSYKLNIYGITPGGTATYSGNKSDISVSSNSTTNLGVIAMEPLGSNQLWRIDSLISGTVIATHSNKYLTVGSDGVDAIQGSSQYGWRFASNGGYYQIISENSGKCLEVAGGSRSDGANVVTSTCSQGDHQLWAIVDRGAKYYQVRAKHSAKCLDVEGNSRADGANVQQYYCK